MPVAQATADPYKITVDPVHGYVRLDLFGFWHGDTAMHLVRELRAAIGSLGLPPGQYVALTDARRFEVQSAETTEALKLLTEDSTMRPRRHALLNGRALVRMQGVRQFGNTGTVEFPSEEEALVWLFSDAAG